MNARRTALIEFLVYVVQPHSTIFKLGELFDIRIIRIILTNQNKPITEVQPFIENYKLGTGFMILKWPINRSKLSAS